MRIHKHGRPRRAAWAALPIALLLLIGCQLPGTLAEDRSAPSTAPKSANGVAELPPKQILDRAGEASKSARSVRIRGEFRDGSEVLGLDVRIAGKNKAAATITMEGMRIRLIRIGSAAYVRGDAKFLRTYAGPDGAAMLAGKYIKSNAADRDFRDLTSFTLMSYVVSEVTRDPGVLTKGGRAQVNGRPAIALTDSAGGKLYVATEGKPYLLRLDAGPGTERLDFLAYDRPAKIKPPPADRVIDVR